VNAYKLAKMLRIRMSQRFRRILDDVFKYIKKLHKQGRSYGRIAEIIFDVYELSYSISRIGYILKKNGGI